MKIQSIQWVFPQNFNKDEQATGYFIELGSNTGEKTCYIFRKIVQLFGSEQNQSVENY